MIRALLVALLLAFAAPAPAFEPIVFESTEEEERYRALLYQLRCVMCQNQSLADSPADIAGDLRMQVLDLVREGRSDEEVRAFLVERYGEFIVYQPPVNPATWILWFGPGLILLGGAVALVVTVRRKSSQSRGAARPPMDEDQEW